MNVSILDLQIGQVVTVIKHIEGYSSLIGVPMYFVAVFNARIFVEVDGEPMSMDYNRFFDAFAYWNSKVNYTLDIPVLVDTDFFSKN